SSLYLNGEDYIFTYTPPVNQTVDITLTGTDAYTGVFLFDGCPTSGGTCVTNNTSVSVDPSLCGVNITAGTTYYIVISTNPAPDCTPFYLSIRENIISTINSNCKIGNYSVSSNSQ
ncbi:MAG: hypothetical protein L3J42_01290, partial [Hydrogenimonas sp.]|nr:hypothetical protein [Hydrogenimonas sp.]